MGRWSPALEAALKKMFIDETANPARQDNGYMNGLWEAAGVGSLFQEITQERFRYHYKKKGRHG
jgi:hypothetical protein